ncbi:unnamed protein product [Paramecium pentaurelia]|uniref:VHS domain-containing protein n=1 Tax=Paramecium pentaurelia TaxID=43138 RepID=A0A8S1V007_9CILI|nr:unnamed protein product [Paramecium pentaurelia]
MEKDKKEFQNKQASKLADIMSNQALIEEEKIVFLKNIKLGSHLYIDPLVDTVKKTLKSKFPFQTKFNALMLLKDAMDTRNKEIANYVTIKVLDRLKAIAKQSLKPDKNKLFTPPESGDEFYLLLLECLYNWSIFFQLPADLKMQPSAFKNACSELQQAGIRFPTQFKYFQNIDLQNKKPEQTDSKQNQQQQQKQQQQQQQQKETPKPQTKPQTKPQSKPKKNEKQAYQKAIDSLMSLTGLFKIIIDILRENEDISYLQDFCQELQQVINPIETQMFELEEEDYPNKELLTEDLIKLSSKGNELVADIQKCQKKQMSWNVLKNKHHPKLQDFIQSLKFPQDDPNLNEKQNDVQDQPKDIQQSDQKIQEGQKQMPQNDNPFFFSQVANFEIEDIEKTKSDLIQQQLQKQQQQQQPIPTAQIQKQQETPQKQQEQTTPKMDQWDSQQVPVIWNQPENTKIPENDIQFPGFEQRQATDPDNQFQTQWNMPEQKQEYFDNPFQLQNFDSKDKHNLPFDSKRHNTDPDSQNGWGVQKQEFQEQQWDPGFNPWQNIRKDSKQDEEVVVEKMRPTIIPQPQEQQQQRKKNLNPFERQLSVTSEDQNQQFPKDGFTGFSKVMDNKSEFKTEVDSKPDSNIFKFNDQDIDLEIMAGSSKLSKQDRSKSVDSQQGMPMPQNQWEPQSNFQDFKNKEVVAGQNTNFQWEVEIKKQDPDDFVDPYVNRFEDDFNKKEDRYAYNDHFENSTKFDQFNINDQNKFDNKYTFDIQPEFKTNDNQKDTKFLKIYNKVIEFSIDNCTKTARKSGIRMADAEVQASEQILTLLKNNPQQEMEHQEQKQKLIKEIQKLKQENYEYQQEIKEQNQIIEKYEKDFQSFKQQSSKWTDAQTSLNNQLINLNEYYKQQKQQISILQEEISKLSNENQQLNDKYCESIKQISDYKCNEDSLMNKIRIIEKQFKQISFNHKCPIQQYLEQYLKVPNLIDINMPTRLSVIPKDSEKKTTRIEVKYDTSLFMDILRGCAQPYSNEIDDFKFSILMSRAVLYEDKVLQIGCITKINDDDLSLLLHIRNKSQNNISITKINLIAPSNNQLNKSNVQDGSVLQKYTNFKIQLKFQYQEFMKQPILEFSIDDKQYHILLPVSLIKFGISEVIDIVCLKEKWKINKNMKCVIKSTINQPNHKFINQLLDFKRYFQTLQQFDNYLMMQLNINQSEFGIKFKEDRQRQQLIIKVQSSQLLKSKAEELIQQLLFLFSE